MNGVARQDRHGIAHSHTGPRRDRREFLGIDGLFFEGSAGDGQVVNRRRYPPFVLPCAAVELENRGRHRIVYSVWKLLCVRASLRVLICYQRTSTDIKALKADLEKVIQAGRLQPELGTELLILIGDES